MEVVVITGTIRRAKPQSCHHLQQTNIQFFYRPDALPVTQPTVSKHWSEKNHIPWTCLPQAHLGVFQLCLWPLLAPRYLGGGLHASHQPSHQYPKNFYSIRYYYYFLILSPSVLWHCWFGYKKGIRPVKSWVLVYWWRFDWSFARLVAPVVTTTSIALSCNKTG